MRQQDAPGLRKRAPILLALLFSVMLVCLMSALLLGVARPPGVSAERYGPLGTGGLLVVGALFTAVVLAAVYYVRRLRLTSAILTARLEAAAAHEREMRDINQRLAFEIDERRQVEEAKLRGEERYRALVDASPDVIYTLAHEDGTITSLNPAFEQISGWPADEWIGRSFLQIIHPDDRSSAISHFDEIVRSGRPDRQEFRYLHRSGEYHQGEFSAVPLMHNGLVGGVIGVARDISERVRLEEQLRHAVKMQAVGLLAGGVAHEFNNMLTVITGFGSIMLMKTKQDDPLRGYIEKILSSTDRAARLTKNLLTFSRKRTPAAQPTDLGELVRRTAVLIGPLVGESIVTDLIIEPAGLTVLADALQLEQVLMNLAANARDAMGRTGRLTIRTAACRMDDDFIRARGFGEKGDYAVLEVRDTGAGMDMPTLQRIFEPFFTTKETGRGTGLGLAIVFGIVRQHGGYIDVASTPGRGTTVAVYLPVVSDGMQQNSPDDLVLTAPGGTGTILLAEDDEDVRRSTKGMLEEYGYTVLEAADGQEAIDIFSRRRDDIGLLILDVVMPRLNGMDVCERARQLKPGTRVLLMSGYAADLINDAVVPRDAVRFVSKPVKPRDLVRNIEELFAPPA